MLDREKNTIIITGNPFDGFQYYGPYSNIEDLMNAASYVDDEHWFIPLNKIEVNKYIAHKTILVAFNINMLVHENDDADQKTQESLMAELVKLNDSEYIQEWWIAEDKRFDRSDNESAIFIPSSMNQLEAYERLAND